MRAFKQLVIANFKEMIRDGMQLFWFILFPLIIVLIFGLIFSKDAGKSNFKVGLVIEDTKEAGTSLGKAFESVPNFKIYKGGREEEKKAFEDGERDIVVIVPEGMTEKITSQKNIDIPVYYSEKNSIALFSVSEILNGYERKALGQSRIINISGQTVNTSDSMDKASRVDFGMSMILAITLMQLGLFGSIRIVALRERKILKSLGATPLPRILLIVSEVIVRMVMSVVQAIIIIAVGHFVFGLKVSGNWIAVFGWVILGATAFVCIGYMLAAFVKTVESGNGIVQLIVMPMMFLSGIFVPVEMMPEFMQPVVRVIPLTYLADGMGSAITGYAATYGLLTDALVLVGTIAVSFAFAIRFKWE